MDEKTESVAPAVLFSERTWTESGYVQEREKAAKEIAKAIGVPEKKAKAYIDSVNSIAKMIAEDRVQDQPASRIIRTAKKRARDGWMQRQKRRNDIRNPHRETGADFRCQFHCQKVP